MLGFWISLNGLFWGTLSSLKAKEKNRNEKNWFLLGFIFSFFAYLVIITLSSLNREKELKNLENEKETLAISTY